MSIEILSNRIIITNQSGLTTFDTNYRMMYIHSTVALSISIPSRSGKTSGVQQVNILVGTIPYPADFFIGCQAMDGYYREINGSFHRGSSWVNKSWGGSRFLTLLLDNTNIYMNDMWFSNDSDITFNGMTTSFYIYAGNYDL
jgi:hypothetical protein